MATTTNELSWEGSSAVVKKSSSRSLSKKVSEKFERTKEIATAGVEETKVVASAGFGKTRVVARKVKDGATVSVNWLKLKYKLFHRK